MLNAFQIAVRQLANDETNKGQLMPTEIRLYSDSLLMLHFHVCLFVFFKLGELLELASSRCVKNVCQTSEMNLWWCSGFFCCPFSNFMTGSKANPLTLPHSHHPIGATTSCEVFFSFF